MCCLLCVCTCSSFRHEIFVALHLSKSSRPPVSCWNFYLFVLVLVMTLLMNADLTPWNFVCVPSSIVDNCACHTRLSTSAHQIVLSSIFALLFLMKRRRHFSFWSLCAGRAQGLVPRPDLDCGMNFQLRHDLCELCTPPPKACHRWKSVHVGSKISGKYMLMINFLVCQSVSISSFPYPWLSCSECIAHCIVGLRWILIAGINTSSRSSAGMGLVNGVSTCSCARCNGVKRWILFDSWWWIWHHST